MSNPDPTVPRPVPDIPNGQTWTWTEQDSAAFLDTADLFVPARAEQIATLVSLIPASSAALTDPADRGEASSIAELASGDGSLALAVLDAFPTARYLALDGSQAMLEQTRTRTAAHADRVETRLFRLEEHAWRAALPQPLRCVLSSLCLHHLDGAARRQPGGALLLA
ncbi:MAG TPA: class I SAM-dependent methyltransferase, partial [Ktedonobacterales bacterium]|nr:class I SAM-dependent methyltransferase [Ktedonobacterales bacterium]